MYEGQNILSSSDKSVYAKHDHHKNNFNHWTLFSINEKFVKLVTAQKIHPHVSVLFLMVLATIMSYRFVFIVRNWNTMKMELV